jgi:hypothetical protein
MKQIDLGQTVQIIANLGVIAGILPVALERGTGKRFGLGLRVLDQRGSR